MTLRRVRKFRSKAIASLAQRRDASLVAVLLNERNRYKKCGGIDIRIKSVPTLRYGNSKSDEKAKMSTLIAIKSENVTELKVYHWNNFSNSESGKDFVMRLFQFRLPELSSMLSFYSNSNLLPINFRKRDLS